MCRWASCIALIFLATSFFFSFATAAAHNITLPGQHPYPDDVVEDIQRYIYTCRLLYVLFLFSSSPYSLAYSPILWRPDGAKMHNFFLHFGFLPSSPSSSPSSAFEGGPTVQIEVFIYVLFHFWIYIIYICMLKFGFSLYIIFDHFTNEIFLWIL